MNRRALRCLLAGLAPAVAAALAACGSVSLATPTPVPPSVLVPADLQVPAGRTLQRTLTASGVQIYECRAAADGGGAGWAFVAPEAQLSDAQGRPAGRHYAGPTWEAPDGSKVVGTVRAKADAPDPADIPWLLLDTHSTGPAGAFANVIAVQRLATHGGAAPAADACTVATLGQRARVPYTATYTQYAKAL